MISDSINFKLNKIIHSFADRYLAIFSEVGGGKSSGVNLDAAAILPLIFIFPCINAIYGFKVPLQTDSKSPSVIVNTASGFSDTFYWTFPYPFLRSISKINDGFSPFFFVISKPRTEFTFGINPLPSPLSKYTPIISNIYSDIKPDFGLTGVYSYFYSSYYFS